MDYEPTEEEDIDALQAAVRRGIRGADPPDVGARDWRPLGLALRAPDGALSGGLYGATMWGWLMIDGLWVAEELRGQGLGRRLLFGAEAAAVKRGCRGAKRTLDAPKPGPPTRVSQRVAVEALPHNQ